MSVNESIASEYKIFHVISASRLHSRSFGGNPSCVLFVNTAYDNEFIALIYPKTTMLKIALCVAGFRPGSRATLVSVKVAKTIDASLAR